MTDEEKLKSYVRSIRDPSSGKVNMASPIEVEITIKSGKDQQRIKFQAEHVSYHPSEFHLSALPISIVEVDTLLGVSTGPRRK